MGRRLIGDRRTIAAAVLVAALAGCALHERADNLAVRPRQNFNPYLPPPEAFPEQAPAPAAPATLGREHALYHPHRRGCGARGGPGTRLPNGRCASWTSVFRRRA